MNSRIQIIANGGAKGMADGEARTSFAELVQSVLPGAGLEFVEEGSSIPDLVRQAIHRGASVIAAGGGDGTINAVASELIGTSLTLGVLPLGTLNHFAKDVGIAVEVEDALRVLADGRVLNIDVGCVSGRHFLNNSGLGLYPDMVHNRVQRQKRGMSKWAAMMIEGAAAFGRYRLLRLQFQVEGKAVHRRTPAVFVGNNDYSLDGTIASERTSLTDGTLCLYVPHSQNRLGLVWFSLRAFFGSPKPGTDFDKLLCTAFTINSHHRKLRVSIDGEVTTMAPPLEYCIKPAALRVQVPVAPVGDDNA
ncbi:MAG: diacylglycerol/lipid kinase family protein [Gemmatimonas sp.]